MRLRLRAPEDVHPDVQQGVIERRRAVLAQDAGDLAERVRADADAEALVDPEVRVQLRRPQDERERDEGGQAGDFEDGDAGERPLQRRGSAQGDGGHGTGG